MLPHLRKDIKPGYPGTLRLGQDGAAFAPPFPARKPENSQLAVADATSTDTPGPMVELIETFFM